MNPTIDTGIYDLNNYYSHPEIGASRFRVVIKEDGLHYLTEIRYPETPEYGVVVSARHDPLTMYTIEKVKFDKEGKTYSGWKPTSMTYVTDVDEYINTSCYIKEDLEKVLDIMDLTPPPF